MSMSDGVEDTKPSPPSLAEARLAFWVASYAKSVVKQIVETGHAEGDDFIALCGSLFDLEMNTIGGVEFHERAEDFHDLETQPVVS